MNKLIGILIVLLYFGNFHICKFLYNGNVNLFWDLKVSIYCLLIYLAFIYQNQKTFLEKLFFGIVGNNVYVLLVHKEINYTFNDFALIILFTLLQYATKYIRERYILPYRDIRGDFNNKK